MKTIFLTVFAIACLTFCLVTSLRSELVVDEATVYPKSILRELELIRPLMVGTNQAFDEMLCKSMQTNIDRPFVVSYQEISFVFHYPTTNHLDEVSSSEIDNVVVPSSSEIDHPYQLLCKNGNTSRVFLYTNDVPLNYIRLYDPGQKQTSAELDLLLGISPLGDPHATQYLKRSFQFIYKDGWKGQ